MATEVLITSRFKKWMVSNELEDAVDGLRTQLLATPTLGKVVPRSGGIRKIRVAGRGRGKRGGYRVLYSILLSGGYILLLAGYDKSEKEDLTDDELKLIRAEAELAEAALAAKAEREGQAHDEE